MTKELNTLVAASVAMVSFAVTTLVGIAVVTQMKNNALIDNTTADLFIAGLVLFGTFSTLVALVIIGKVVIGLVRSKD